ncbi:MAG: hypothetical protein HZC36_11695 [Armatimonadetes bacterium]|nr:hypothetical protein [Armatimonadota bacterium]
MIPVLSSKALALLAAKAILTGPPSPTPGIQGPAPPPAQSPKVNPSYFNPQMAIIGVFDATLRDNSGEKRHADMKELEFGFAGDVDPFMKVTAIAALTKDEEGKSVFELEEAFGLYTKLGKGLTAKVGKFAAAIGRVQRNHPDQLDTSEYPLIIQDTMGDEGLRQSGASLSYLLPGDRFNELTFEIMDAGDEGPLFNGSSLGSPVYVGRYRTFFDFNEDLSGQLGFSYANGPTMPMAAADGAKRGDLYGVDYTMKWRPGTKGRSAHFEAEAYWAKPGGFGKRTMGAFGRLVYEVAPRWHLTTGLDYSEIPGTSDSRHGVLAGLTFKLTEFQHWRLEWQRISSNFEPTRDVLRLQLQWLIGTHPAHKY